MDSLITMMNMIYYISYAGVISCVLVCDCRFLKGNSFGAVGTWLPQTSVGLKVGSKTPL